MLNILVFLKFFFFFFRIRGDENEIARNHPKPLQIASKLHKITQNYAKSARNRTNHKITWNRTKCFNKAYKSQNITRCHSKCPEIATKYTKAQKNVRNPLEAKLQYAKSPHVFKITQHPRMHQPRSHKIIRNHMKSHKNHAKSHKNTPNHEQHLHEIPIKSHETTGKLTKSQQNYMKS